MKNHRTTELLLKGVSRLAMILSLAILLAMGYLIYTGLPSSLGGMDIRLKHLKMPFCLFVLSLAIFIWAPPDRIRRWESFRRKAEYFTARPFGIWMLVVLFGVLYTWQQVKEYYALEINFLPFSYYDYMLFYFFQGKINYTHHLHQYYHVNNIVYLLAPVWYFAKSPFVLVLSYGWIAALAALPLFGIARMRFRDNAVAPFSIAFIFLNYRYLQNLLRMNFSVELFYPLLVFAAVYFAMRRFWFWYYVFLALGLSVKEDSFFYFSLLGAMLLFMRPREGRAATGRLHGIATVCLSFGYLLFVTKFFLPRIGSDILASDFENYQASGSSFGELAAHFLRSPQKILLVYFHKMKIETILNLLYRLLFLPLFSPAVLLMLGSLFPLFFRESGMDADFYRLNYQYAGAVLPFVFLAFVFGFSNLYHAVPGRFRSSWVWGVCLAMILINGFRFTAPRVTPENRQSLRWVREIPAGANLVTHGHLLPHIGYRKHNYYLAKPWEDSRNPFHLPYSHADYYYIDLTVPPYPLDRGFLEQKIRTLMGNPEYELVKSDGERRYLFGRRDVGTSEDMAFHKGMKR